MIVYDFLINIFKGTVKNLPSRNVTDLLMPRFLQISSPLADKLNFYSLQAPVYTCQLFKEPR